MGVVEGCSWSPRAIKFYPVSQSLSPHFLQSQTPCSVVHCAFVISFPKGGGGGGHQAIGLRIGVVVRTLQQIQALKVEEMWGLIFMAHQLGEIAGTLPLLKKEDMEAGRLFREHRRRKREGI